MLRPGGYGMLVEAGKTTEEKDSFTCFHCQRCVWVKPMMSPSDMGGWCAICTKLICQTCAGKGCTPWEKQLEKEEARYRFLKSAGLFEQGKPGTG